MKVLKCARRVSLLVGIETAAAAGHSCRLGGALLLALGKAALLLLLGVGNLLLVRHLHARRIKRRERRVSKNKSKPILTMTMKWVTSEKEIEREREQSRTLPPSRRASKLNT